MPSSSPVRTAPVQRSACHRFLIGPWSLLLSSMFATACLTSCEEAPSQDASDGGAGNGANASGATTGAGGNASGGTDAATTGGSGGDSALGGASSGGAGSGGAPNDGDFFGASRCDQAGLLLCDGFEGATIDSALWTISKADGNTVELTTDHAARGQKSIHIVANNGHGYLENDTIFPVANNDYFGRMFLRVKRFSTTVAHAHWTVAEGAGSGNGSKIRVGGQYSLDDSFNFWGVGSDGGPTGDWTWHDDDPDGMPEEPPTDAWTCLEWEHKGSTNETRFFVDGIEHPSLHTTATNHGGNQSEEYILPMMQSFWFGWVQYQGDPEPFDVWIDEVALDDERIGCAK